MRRFQRFLGLAVVGAASCSLVIGTDSLVEGEVSGGDASVGSDAAKDALPASDASDGATADSPVSESSADVIVDDVVTDAVDAGTFCESLLPAPTICSDFDVQQLPAGWDTLAGYNADFTGTVDSTDFVSPPRSISFTTPPLAVDDQGARTLSKKLSTPTKSISIEFDFRPESLGDSWTWVVVIESSNQNGTVYLRLRMRSTGFDVNEYAEPSGGAPPEYAGFDIPGTPDPTKWQHAKWDIDVASAFSNVELDGVSTGESSLIKTYLDNPTLKIGISYAETPSVAQKIRFDNIVVRVE